MQWLPYIVVFLVFVIGYTMFKMLPDINDQGNEILWCAGAFIVLFFLAGFYLTRALPSVAKSPSIQTPAQQLNIVVRDP